MTGRHSLGRHRRSNSLRNWGQAAALGAAFTAIIFALSNSPQPVANVRAVPEPPLMALSTTTSTTTPSPTPTTTMKKKRPQRTTQRARRAALEKDQLDVPVTPRPPPSIKVERTTEPPEQAPQPRAVAPRVPQSSLQTELKRAPLVVNRDNRPTVIQSTKFSAPKTSSKSAPKTTPRMTTTPRAVPSKIVRGNQSQERITTTKPAVVSTVAPPLKPTVVSVTTNSRCATLGLLPVPKAACSQILAAFPQVSSVLGVGNRSGNPTSCHPKGLAVDFIVGTNKALGDRLYAFVIARRSALGASPVVLWQVADHFDHVHVSFNPCKG